MTERKLGIAGLQLKKRPGAAEKNLRNLERTVRLTKRKYPWVDLLFVGELYLQAHGDRDWKEHAAPIPNGTTERLCELSREVECWLVPGSFLEKEGNKIFNTAVAINPQGEMVSKYRKIFPWAPHEDTDYGTDFVVFDIPGIARIGLTICYDVWFPEIFRTLVWMGAEVVLQPSATYTPDRRAELILTQAQAIMNQCYVLNSNVIQAQGGGLSLFVGPEGRVLQEAGTNEEVMIEAIDIDRVHWLRQHGSFAIDPVWKCLRDSPLEGKFPVYENLKTGEVFKELGATRVQDSLREWRE